MSNLVSVLNAQGRVAESRILARKLEQMEPDPPFSFFDRGLTAMRNGDFKAARDLFAKEVDRAPYYHEFHFWLAVAYVGLGEMEQAKEQLTIAMEYSTTRNDRDLYAAKLDRIRSFHLQ
jgi:tetratricopeptide (TPR) repeat protein